MQRDGIHLPVSLADDATIARHCIKAENRYIAKDMGQAQGGHSAAKEYTLSCLTEMIINRVWAMPNKWTFKIPCIAQLLARYVGDGKGWIDPFAGYTSPAEFTNDLDPCSPAKNHMDALEFIRSLNGQAYAGFLFDPPYSLTQMKECYAEVNKALTLRESTQFYGDIRKAIKHKIMPGGIAISFGWNSIGIGKTHGFQIIEILMVCHGRAHNDTIVTVERKVQGAIDL